MDMEITKQGWKVLTKISDFHALLKQSDTIPCLLYKHSTRCELSTIMWYQLCEFKQQNSQTPCYFVDVVSQVALSQQIAQQLNELHQSPQILLIHQGDCILEASHTDINAEEIEEELAFLKNS